LDRQIRNREVEKKPNSEHSGKNNNATWLARDVKQNNASSNGKQEVELQCKCYESEGEIGRMLFFVAIQRKADRTIKSQTSSSEKV
jgi:hypothetical protein